MEGWRWDPKDSDPTDPQRSRLPPPPPQTTPVRLSSCPREERPGWAAEAREEVVLMSPSSRQEVISQTEWRRMPMLLTEPVSVSYSTTGVNMGTL
jgi:hypothetical protein